jgi:hypothetical protein
MARTSFASPSVPDRIAQATVHSRCEVKVSARPLVACRKWRVRKTTSNVTERPIAFRAENVLAIVAGRKTQARRLVDPHPDGPSSEGVANMQGLDLCPYGSPGDRLWVSETIRRDNNGRWHYAADNELVSARKSKTAPLTVAPLRGAPANTYTAGYMPRWAARILLEITDVRVQRLQDISIQDAVAEGPPCWSCGGPVDGVGMKGCACFGSTSAARPSFVMLWERSHAETDPWASNPWVWALTFRKIDGPRRGRKKTEPMTEASEAIQRSTSDYGKFRRRHEFCSHQRSG